MTVNVHKLFEYDTMLVMVEIEQDNSLFAHCQSSNSLELLQLILGSLMSDIVDVYRGWHCARRMTGNCSSKKPIVRTILHHVVHKLYFRVENSSK